MFRRTAALLALALCLAAAPARAETPEEKRALELFGQSEDAYQKGQFRQAADLLREAYALKKEPVLLYNLARADEGLGDLESAVKAYEDFLAAQPEAKDRGAIEQRVATLKRQIAEREAAKRRAAMPPPAPPPPERRPSAVPWILVGFGAAGLGTGAAFALLSSGRHKDAVGEPVQILAAHDQDVAKTDATIATVAFIAGSALAATGLAWGILDLRASGKQSARVGLTPAPGGLRLTGTF